MAKKISPSTFSPFEVRNKKKKKKVRVGVDHRCYGTGAGTMNHLTKVATK